MIQNVNESELAMPLDLLPSDPAAARALVTQAILQSESMLFLDRVVGQGDAWLEGEWRVPERPELFRGARARILPGTLICEHAVQAGELLIHALRGETTSEEGVPVLTRMRQARFRRMVLPGDVLRTRVELVDQLGPIYKVQAAVRCEGARVLEVGLDFAATAALAEAARG
jgi:3-hydroxymyristoyl/3-hydroxydecanoyl-(acyl carrier protein) dehydratase